MSTNTTYSVSRSFDNGDTQEWIATFPTYTLARAFLSGVFNIQAHNRLPWGTNQKDGYVMPDARYFITALGRPVEVYENIGSIPA